MYVKILKNIAGVAYNLIGELKTGEYLRRNDIQDGATMASRIFDTWLRRLRVAQTQYGLMFFADYAGRRTFDTCIRAKTLWGIDHAILISQGYHLPRALWTCETLGIESMGLSATLQPYVKEFIFKLREIGAIYKAFFDLYLVTPDYLRGTFIRDLDPES